MSFTHCYPVTAENIDEVAEKAGVDLKEITYKALFADLHEYRLFVFVRKSGEVSYKLVGVDKLDDEEFNLFRFMQTGEI